MKRKYNTTFLNKRKNSEDNESKQEEPLQKKLKTAKRHDGKKRDKYDFITYMHDHPNKSVSEMRDENKWNKKMGQYEFNLLDNKVNLSDDTFIVFVNVLSSI
eukprot:89713_1